MRKIIPFLSLFILLSAFTCENEPLEGDLIEATVTQENNNDSNDNDNGNDDNNNNNNNNEASLIGEWTATSFSANVTSTTSANGMDNVVEISITGMNLGYNLVFAESTYTTNGNYDAEYTTVINGQNNASGSDSYTGVMGSGNYSTNGNMMTIDGSFFELSVNGVDTSSLGGEQTTAYELSADGQTLTFNQNETETNNTGGVDVTTNIVSTSVWQKI